MATAGNVGYGPRLVAHIPVAVSGLVGGSNQMLISSAGTLSSIAFDGTSSSNNAVKRANSFDMWANGAPPQNGLLVYFNSNGCTFTGGTVPSLRISPCHPPGWAAEGSQDICLGSIDVPNGVQISAGIVSTTYVPMMLSASAGTAYILSSGTANIIPFRHFYLSWACSSYPTVATGNALLTIYSV